MDMENLIKPGEAAEILGVHSNTVRNWAALGILSMTRTPTNQRRLDRTEVEALALVIIIGDSNAGLDTH
jgi:excisionase family DNA binding protein